MVFQLVLINQLKVLQKGSVSDTAEDASSLLQIVFICTVTADPDWLAGPEYQLLRGVRPGRAMQSEVREFLKARKAALPSPESGLFRARSGSRNQTKQK